MPREHPARDESPQISGAPPPPRAKRPIAILLAALAAGALMGSFEIANTSIGWHLASGRLILEQRAIPEADPFSLTAGGTPWLDHEWLFQVAAALADGLGGAPALVALRALAAAALAALLLAVGLRSGLAPPAALLLALLCVAGARPRFFVRPELVTLLVAPAGAWLYLTRRERRPAIWAGGLAALMVVGVNAHGGALLVPFLLAGLLAAEAGQSLLRGRIDRGALGSGAVGVAVAALAVLANPAGWRLYAVPFELAHLVGRPHVSNPEWFPPSVAQVPQLFVAIAVAVVVMGVRERSLVRWALLLMAGALALRHVRHLGLLFVLLPLAVAPALASWRALARDEDETSAPARRARGLALVAAGVLALALAIAPQPRFGFAYAAGFYPTAACDFLDREGLPKAELYNDVRFGGYLIDRYWPARRVFQDDRNEIHEPVLREIWEIFARSDVAAFTGLLEGHRCDTALVRYHPPWRVAGPEGASSGIRGFSALWFPEAEWALVYWDDVAMVFVRRGSADPTLLERAEYRLIRPDDFDFVAARITADPERHRLALAEAQRALRTSPDSGRAAAILTKLAIDAAGPVIDR
jgi:hypothetical protein